MPAILFSALLRSFFIALSVGMYISIMSLLAEERGWSGALLGTLFFSNSVGSFSAYMILGATAQLTLHHYFDVFVGVLMASFLSVGLLMGESYEFWVCYSVVKGFMHTHFYHGVRLTITRHKRSTSPMPVFSLNYLILCLGCIAGLYGVLFAGEVKTALVLFLAPYLLLIALATWDLKRYRKAFNEHAPLQSALTAVLKLIRAHPRSTALGLIGGVLGETLYGFIISIQLELGFEKNFALNSFSLMLAGAALLMYPLCQLQSTSPKRTVPILLVLGAAGVLVVGFSTSVWCSAIAVFAVGGIFAALAVVGDTCIYKAEPNDPSGALQVGALTYLVGKGVADPIVGFLLDAGGSLGVSGFFVVILGCMYCLVKPLAQERDFIVPPNSD